MAKGFSRPTVRTNDVATKLKVKALCLKAPSGKRMSRRLALLRMEHSLKAKKHQPRVFSWALRVPSGDRKSQRLAVLRVGHALSKSGRRPSLGLWERSGFSAEYDAGIVYDQHASVEASIQAHKNTNTNDQADVEPAEGNRTNSENVENTSENARKTILKLNMAHMLLGEHDKSIFPKTPRLAERTERKLFQRFSPNMEKISRSAFKTALSKAGMRPKADVINSVFCSLDVDKDGAINYKEFSHGLATLK
mmetsp:Transcript_15474/g.18639  ORF Transcript_15474/g.18639 Transcript_15474/m.18639 type:complete len:250 (+) Transcript_15474:74-823(+)|eukprot:jgi/Bigna1/89007/estExt_fgenesh1_pg.C_420066